MIRAVLDNLAETAWRDWLDNAAQLVGVAVIVCALGYLAVAFAPPL